MASSIYEEEVKARRENRIAWWGKTTRRCNTHDVALIREGSVYYCKICEAQAAVRRQQYRDSLKEHEKHANEKCPSCDKPIDFETWFCYCSLCPDCFLNSKEEIDNYLGEQNG